MSFKDFLIESLIDDILADFDLDKETHDHTVAKCKDDSYSKVCKNVETYQSKAYPPRVIKGTSDKMYPDYVRSEAELKAAIKEKLGSTELSVKNIALLYANHDIVPDDSFIVNLRVDDLFEYREYDRDIEHDFTGKMTSQEFAELKRSIEEHGIKHHGILRMVKEDTDVEVILGEGNHRLKIARELGIETMPVGFYVT